MPADRRRHLRVIDTHYGGDVSRVVVSGVGDIPGATVREKRDFLAERADGLRRLLLYPPHGDPAMCANLIVPPSNGRARAGYIIMEAMGYPHFSGSNSICTVTALLESGLIPMSDGDQSVTLEAPAGLVETRARCAGGRVLSVAVEGPPAYVVARGLTLEVPARGQVELDVVWSGCFYAVVRGEEHGFSLSADEIGALRGFARDLCLAARGNLELRHPELGDVGPLSFICIAGSIEAAGPKRWRARSATYVHPDVLCACPTGTGTSARLACLRADGLIERGDELETTSPGGSRMRGVVLADVEVDGRPAVRTEIAGRAFTLADSRRVVDLDDDRIDGDGLWDLLVD